MKVIEKQETDVWRNLLQKNGYLVLEGLLDLSEVAIYSSFCEDVIYGSLKHHGTNHRHDLGSHVERKISEIENIVQVHDSFFLFGMKSHYFVS